MAEYTLLMVEATGIQEYVFGSNHLAQNLGASELVFRVTTRWVQQTLAELALASNIVSWDESEGGLLLNTALTVTQAEDGIAVEVIYAGGGNALLLFADTAQAQQFTRSLTARVLQEAPGLRVVAARKTFAWTDTSVALAHRALRQEMGAIKRNPPVSQPILGLGVTASCVFTGLPAAGFHDDAALVGRDAAEKIKAVREEPRLIAATVAGKLRHEHLARDRLKGVLPQSISRDFELVYDFDQFGVKGESNYIAVIHTDGNNMGDRFEALVEKYQRPDQNRDYLAELARLSKSVRDAARQALSATAAYLVDSLDLDDDRQKFGGVVPIPVRNGAKYLPFRPIIFDGDDTTIVTEGRLGLALAAKYLQEFTKTPLADGQPVFARAGVAVVKAHFPFSRAYWLAESLARSAKRQIPRLKAAAQPGANVMDWHVSTTGVNFGLSKIREREYTVEFQAPGTGDITENSLLMRPIRVDPAGTSANGAWRTWQMFSGLMREFQRPAAAQPAEDDKPAVVWAERRNKLLALRQALRDGPEAVRLFRTNYRIDKLPPIQGQPAMAEQGWQGRDCGYYDAVEALDFYVALEPEPEQEKTA